MRSNGNFLNYHSQKMSYFYLTNSAFFGMSNIKDYFDTNDNITK